MALLGIGIYIQLDASIASLGLSDFLSNPAIVVIILGSVLFLLGFLRLLWSTAGTLPLAHRCKHAHTIRIMHTYIVCTDTV